MLLRLQLLLVRQFRLRGRLRGRFSAPFGLKGMARVGFRTVVRDRICGAAGGVTGRSMDAAISCSGAVG